MSRELWYVDRNTGKLITPEEYYVKYGRGNAAHYVIQDTMPPTEHMIDGRIYESKSAFRAVTKAHGCVEIGTEKQKIREPRILDPLPYLKQAFDGFRE